MTTLKKTTKQSAETVLPPVARNAEGAIPVEFDPKNVRQELPAEVGVPNSNREESK